LYVSSGPLVGCEVQISARLPSGHVQLSSGAILGAWWLEEEVTQLGQLPLSPTAPIMPPFGPSRFKSVMEAVLRVESLPAMPGPPLGFLSGAWCGNAIVLSKERLEHPTAPEDRAQPLFWVLGEDSSEGRGDDGSICGAGFTTWPAAHIMLATRGRVWHTISGSYTQSEGRVQLALEWEALPGSRFRADGLGHGQGEASVQQTKLSGCVFWDSRHGQLRMAGLWTDADGVQGAFMLGRQLFDAAMCGKWTGLLRGCKSHCILTVQPHFQPSAFGVVYCSESTAHNRRSKLLRGSVSGTRLCLHMIELASGFLESQSNDDHCILTEVESTSGGCRLRLGTEGGLDMHMQFSYMPLRLSDLLGFFEHSAGGTVEVCESERSQLVISHPKIQGWQTVLASDACQGGTARLFGHLGLMLQDSGDIEWSNGTIWQRRQA